MAGRSSSQDPTAGAGPAIGEPRPWREGGAAPLEEGAASLIGRAPRTLPVSSGRLAAVRAALARPMPLSVQHPWAMATAGLALAVSVGLLAERIVAHRAGPRVVLLGPGSVDLSRPDDLRLGAGRLSVSAGDRGVSVEVGGGLVQVAPHTTAQIDAPLVGAVGLAPAEAAPHVTAQTDAPLVGAPGLAPVGSPPAAEAARPPAPAVRPVDGVAAAPARTAPFATGAAAAGAAAALAALPAAAAPSTPPPARPGVAPLVRPSSLPPPSTEVSRRRIGGPRPEAASRRKAATVAEAQALPPMAAPPTPLASSVDAPPPAAAEAAPLAASPSPQREAELLAAAIHQLRRQGAPASALALLDRHDAEFPHGELERESRRLRIDALLDLGDRARALGLLDRLELGTGPHERDLRVLRGELRGAAGRCREALEDFIVPHDGAHALVERSLHGRAGCHLALGDVAAARKQLEGYLERFPAGRFAGEARRVLGVVRGR